MSRSTPQSELKILFARSGGICAFPRCGRPLVEPGSTTDPAVMVGEAAHIVADSRQGPRGREALSEADRNKHTNLILFCPEHHTIVDARPETYSVAVLRQMKIDHESRVARAVSVAPPPTPAVERTETIYSTVLPVTHLPDAVFSAASTLEDGSEELVKKLIKYPSSHEELVPFLLRENRIFAFHGGGGPSAGRHEGRRSARLRASTHQGSATVGHHPRGAERRLMPGSRAYFDTSVVTKRYVREARASFARALLRRHRCVSFSRWS